MKSPEARGSRLASPSYLPRVRRQSAPERSNWNTCLQRGTSATFVRVTTRVRSGASGSTRKIECAGAEAARSRSSLAAARSKECVHVRHDPIEIPQLAFPNRQDAPTGRRERRCIAAVSKPIARQLRPPVADVRFRQPRDRALRIRVPVPEATVYEDDRMMARQHEIGRTGKVPPMQSKAVTHPVHDRPDDPLRQHVARANPRHAARTISRAQVVGHPAYPPPTPLSGGKIRCSVRSPAPVDQRTGAVRPNRPG